MWTADRVRTGQLLERYTREDVAAISPEDRRRLLIEDSADPQRDPDLAWELLYRLEPELYDRLVVAERLHPNILHWLPNHVERIVEVGAGSGRLTLDLVGRCDELTAIEPATPLRELLVRKLELRRAAVVASGQQPAQVRVIDGFLDALEMILEGSQLAPGRRWWPAEMSPQDDPSAVPVDAEEASAFSLMG